MNDSPELVIFSAENKLEQPCELFEDDIPIIEWRSFLMETPTSSNFEEIFGKQNTFNGRYSTTYADKDVQIWRIWPVLQILMFCDLRSLKNMSMTSTQFKNAAFDIMDKYSLRWIAQYNKNGEMKFLDEFASFTKLEAHVEKYGSASFKLADGSLLSEKEMQLLYQDFSRSCKTEKKQNCGLSLLAEMKWNEMGFKFFKTYLTMLVCGPVSHFKKFEILNKSWKACLDVFTLNYEVIKSRTWPSKIILKKIQVN